LHVIVCALAGAGTSEVGVDVRVVVGLGPEVVGVVVVVRDVVVDAPGCVVIATVPGTVRSHAVASPTQSTAAATASSGMRICATINASAA
jgi:hypothetical protein